MKLYKCFKQALQMVIHSKIRSWLTIIGIVIGIASVIAIISVGNGMKSSITTQLNDFGADILTITTGSSRGFSMVRPGSGNNVFQQSSDSEDEPILNKKDLLALKLVENISIIYTEISGTSDIKFGSESGSLLVYGVDVSTWNLITSDKLSQGRSLTISDKNVAVIGYSLAHDFFDRKIGINQMITINDKIFRVIGILEEGTRNDIYIPINFAYDVIEDKIKDQYDLIKVKATSTESISSLEEAITERLLISRHLTEKNKDFSVSNSLQMKNTVDEMTSTMSMFLVAIASISLLVGAIGIANTMFTSVIEKTKQIGIMKAIGAKNIDILKIFIFNAGIIGMIGGIIGIISGVFLSKLIGFALGTATLIDIQTILISVLVSFFTGIIAGFVPAYNASKLSPVDALRYE